MACLGKESNENGPLYITIHRECKNLARCTRPGTWKKSALRVQHRSRSGPLVLLRWISRPSLVCPLPPINNCTLILADGSHVTSRTYILETEIHLATSPPSRSSVPQMDFEDYTARERHHNLAEQKLEHFIATTLREAAL